MTEQLKQLILLKIVRIKNLIKKFLRNRFFVIMIVLMAVFFFMAVITEDYESLDITNLYLMLYFGFCLIPVAAWFVAVTLLQVSNAEAVHFLAGNVAYRNIVRSDIITTQVLMLAFSGLFAANIMLFTDQGPEMLVKAFLALYSFSSICAWGMLFFFTQRIRLRSRPVAALYLVLMIVVIVSLAEAFQFYAVQESDAVPVGIFPLNMLTSPMMANAYLLAFNAPLGYLIAEFAIAILFGIAAYLYPYSIVPGIDNIEPAPRMDGGASSAAAVKISETPKKRVPLSDTGEGELALDGYFRMETRTQFIAMTMVFTVMLIVFSLFMQRIRFYLMTIYMITFMQVMPAGSLHSKMQILSTFPLGIKRIILSTVRNSIISYIGVSIVASILFMWMDLSGSMSQIIVLGLVICCVPWMLVGSAYLSINPHRSISSASAALLPMAAAFLSPNITLFYVMTFDTFGLGDRAPLLLLPLAGTLALAAFVAYRMAVADWPRIFSDRRNVWLRSATMLGVSAAVSMAIYLGPGLI